MEIKIICRPGFVSQTTCWAIALLISSFVFPCPRYHRRCGLLKATIGAFQLHYYSKYQMFFALLLIGWFKALWIVNINTHQEFRSCYLYLCYWWRMKSRIQTISLTIRVHQWVLINKLNLTLTWSSSLDLSFFFLGVTEAKVTEIHGGYKGFYFFR